MNDLGSHEWNELLALVEDDLRWRQQMFDAVNSLQSEALWGELRRRIWILACVQPEGRELCVDEIDDLVQSMMVQLHRPETLHAIAASEFPRAYVARMMRNRIADRHRAAIRAQWAYETGFLRQQAEPKTEYVTVVREFLHRLSGDERELLYLRFWEGYSIREIATRSKLPYSTVAKRLFRLLAKLRDWLGDVRL